MYANDKVDSDARLDAMLLDVWEANANQDIYILIRLRIDLGRSAGVTSAIQLVWLTGLRAPNLPNSRNSRAIDRTYI